MIYVDDKGHEYKVMAVVPGSPSTSISSQMEWYHKPITTITYKGWRKKVSGNTWKCVRTLRFCQHKEDAERELMAFAKRHGMTIKDELLIRLMATVHQRHTTMNTESPRTSSQGD